LLPGLFLEGRKPLRVPIRSTDSDMIMNVDRV